VEVVLAMAVTTISSLTESFTSVTHTSIDDASLSKENGNSTHAPAVKPSQRDEYERGPSEGHATKLGVKTSHEDASTTEMDVMRESGSADMQGEDDSEESDNDAILEVHD
jgi:hypothetical protein